MKNYLKIFAPLKKEGRAYLKNSYNIHPLLRLPNMFSKLCPAINCDGIR